MLTAAALVIGLTAAASATGHLQLSTLAGAPGPAANVATVPDQTVDPAPDPDPAQPAPDGNGTGADSTARIGSVSQLAEDSADQQRSSDLRRTAVGRHASPAAKSAAIWESRGRPDRLIVVRTGGIDSVSYGRLLRHVVRPVGSITIRSLAAAVPSSWLSIDGSTARMSAALVLTTGVTLTVGSPVSALLLTGGATAPAAASVFTGGGALTLRAVQVTSADPVTGAPMPDGPGRPYISVAGGGGRLDVVDAAVANLGATVGRKVYAGLAFGAGSHGSVVQTTLTGNTVGLALQQSDGVLVENVTASQSAADGIVLSGDTGSSLLDVVAQGNGANGVVVSGRSSPRPISGITTHANHDFGLLVDGQTGPRVSQIVTSNDGAGGVEINHSSDVTVSAVTVTDEPVAVYTHVSSAHVTLDHLSVTGGRRGVVIEKTTTDLVLSSSTVDGAQLGISLGGHQMRLTDVGVSDSQTAVVVERGAGGASFDHLALNGGQFGFIANPGTSGVVVRNLAASGVSATAVRALSPGEQILGGRIDGSVTGIDVQAPTTLSGVTIVGAGTGVRARTPLSIHAQQVDVTAVSVGINIADGTPFQLSDSRVHALESIRGTALQAGPNDLSLPALSVLGAIGVPLILLAVLLEAFAVLRQRRSARRRAGPPGPGGPSVPSVLTDHVAAAR